MWSCLRFVFLFALLHVALCSPPPAGPKKFSSSALIYDTLGQSSFDRTSPSPVKVFYEDRDALNQWLRLDVSGVDSDVSFFMRFGTFDIEWSSCNARCDFRDISDTPFPILYSDGSSGSAVTEDITLLDGTLIPSDSVEAFFFDGNELIVSKQTGFPVRAIWNRARGLVRQIDFLPSSFDASGSFDSDEVFQPPSLFSPDDTTGEYVCAPVDPSCWRLDVVFVLDGSGSMVGSAGGLQTWQWQILFIEERLDRWDFRKGQIHLGYQVFRTKAFNELDAAQDASCCEPGPVERCNITDDPNAFFPGICLNSLDRAYPWNAGDTVKGGLVDGVRMAIQNLKDHGRGPYARSIIIAFTDSVGSSPCCDLSDLSLEILESGVPYQEYCPSGSDCQPKHDAYVAALYEELDAQVAADPLALNPDVFVLGVPAGGSSSSQIQGVNQTVQLVARIASRQLSDSSIPGNPEVATQMLKSWVDDDCDTQDGTTCLDTYERMLRDAVDPSVQCSSQALPSERCGIDDCLVVGGGYCCAGSCGCLEDCSTTGTDQCHVYTCKDGSCTDEGDAQDGTVCDDGLDCTSNDQCVSGVCAGTPDCPDDGNPCTTSSCDSTGSCSVNPLDDGSVCDDGLACTSNDQCVSGVCTGTPDCPDDGNPCTTSSCDSTGSCSVNPVDDGSVCDDGDRCTLDDHCSSGVCIGGALDPSCGGGFDRCNSFKFPLKWILLDTTDVELSLRRDASGTLWGTFTLSALRPEALIWEVDLFVGQLSSKPFKRVHQRFNLLTMRPSAYPVHAYASGVRVWNSEEFAIDPNQGPFARFVYEEVQSNLCGRPRSQDAWEDEDEFDDEYEDEFEDEDEDDEAYQDRHLHHHHGGAPSLWKRWKQRSLYVRVHARVGPTHRYAAHAFSYLFCQDPMAVCCASEGDGSSQPSGAAQPDPVQFDYDYSEPSQSKPYIDAARMGGRGASSSGRIGAGSVVGVVFALASVVVLALVSLVWLGWGKRAMARRFSRN